MKPRIAIAGVTGAVGQEFLRILEQRDFPASSYTMLASARSKGKKIAFRGDTYEVKELTPGSFADIDVALFSAGGSRSKEFAPAAVKAGAAANWFLQPLRAARRSGQRGGKDLLLT